MNKLENFALTLGVKCRDNLCPSSFSYSVNVYISVDIFLFRSLISDLGVIISCHDLLQIFTCDLL